MGSIRVDGVLRVYPGGVRALDHVDLLIADHEFLVLVGPSGCGKSTLLRSIAGLEPIDEGRVHIGEVDVTSKKARDRDIAMVFQSYALYPQMTVRENLEFGLKARRISAADRRSRVAEVAAILGLDALLERRPSELSGGQRQRVAMGRAIVRQPTAFLMDEPLSNLDAKLRVSMRSELAKMHDRFGVTTVYVTHDQIEAMTLGDRVAVMRDGVIQQCDTPRMLFDHPINLFVAAFIGSPSMNFVVADVTAERVQFADWTLAHSRNNVAEDSRVIVGIRPSDFRVDHEAPEGWPRMDVQVVAVEELGAERVVMFGVDAPRVDVDAVRAANDLAAGDQLGFFADDQSALFSAQLSGRDRIEVGSTLRLAVDTATLHFFSTETGLAIV